RAMPGTPVDRLGRRLTDFDLDEPEERQRMPEPIPTSWQSPVMPEPPSAVMRHMGSRLLGLPVGLAIVVPGVLWHKGRIDPQTFIEVTMADLGRAFASTSGAGAINGRRAEADAPRAAIVRVEEIRPSAATEGAIQTVATVASALPLPRTE